MFFRTRIESNELLNLFKSNDYKSLHKVSGIDEYWKQILIAAFLDYYRSYHQQKPAFNHTFLSAFVQTYKTNKSLNTQEYRQCGLLNVNDFYLACKYAIDPNYLDNYLVAELIVQAMDNLKHIKSLPFNETDITDHMKEMNKLFESQVSNDELQTLREVFNTHFVNLEKLIVDDNQVIDADMISLAFIEDTLKDIKDSKYSQKYGLKFIISGSKGESGLQDIFREATTCYSTLFRAGIDDFRVIRVNKPGIKM